MPSFASIYFGCRANQADTAAIEQELGQRGFQAADRPGAADFVVLNSCTVTAAADAELRQTIRRIHRDNPAARILVTGCYAQRRPEELASLPGVEWVVGNSHKSAIPGLLQQRHTQKRDFFVPLASLLPGLSPAADSDLRRLGSIAPSDEISHESPEPFVLVGDISGQRQFVSSAHFGGAVEDRTRPNLKIQDGCNNRCSFCIIPSVRGLSRSLAIEEVLRQIQELTDAGYREVVLSGVNLGQYGRDLHGKPRFLQLIQQILEKTSVERLRLSSVEPMDFSDRLLDLMASSPRIAGHVHAPLQSGSDRILRRMHRRYRVEQYRQRILAAYDRMPEAAFGADVMVGFPGETEEDFEATRRLLEELPFTYLHVFPFSRRPDTPADRMKHQVHGSTVRQRSRILRELAAEKNRRFREQHIGRTLRVLTLQKSNFGSTLALSDNYLLVVLADSSLPPNQWADVRIYSVMGNRLVGRRVPASRDGYESSSTAEGECCTQTFGS